MYLNVAYGYKNALTSHSFFHGCFVYVLEKKTWIVCLLRSEFLAICPLQLFLQALEHQPLLCIKAPRIDGARHQRSRAKIGGEKIRKWVELLVGSIYLPIYPSLYQSINQSISLSIYMSICPSVYLSIYAWLHHGFSRTFSVSMTGLCFFCLGSQ